MGHVLLHPAHVEPARQGSSWPTREPAHRPGDWEALVWVAVLDHQCLTLTDAHFILANLINPKTSSESPFPEIVDGALSSHQVPLSQLSFVGRIKQRFWHFGWHLKQPNVLFSIKTGVGVSILASAAFIPA